MEGNDGRRRGLTEIDGGFCPKLDPWTIGYMRLDEDGETVMEMEMLKEMKLEKRIVENIGGMKLG